MKNYQYFLIIYIDERKILDELNEIFGNKTESYENPDADAKYFVQFNEYEGDIKLGINICWTEGIINNYEQNDVAQLLAKKLKIEVIYEFDIDKNYESREYCLIDRDGKKYALNIEENADKQFIKDKIKIE